MAVETLDRNTPKAPDPHKGEPIPAAAMAEVERLLSSGDLFRYTAPEGAPVALLEAEFAALLGTRYALAVSSCSAALFLALKALDLPRGAKVLIPAFTFAAVPSAVVHADCTPVLVEVGADFRIDLEDFRAKLDGADAVLISHMRGHTSDMDRIMAECDARGLPVIEDAAHSLGTVWKGRNIGTIGRIGCFLGGCCFGAPFDGPWAVVYSDPLAPAAFEAGVPRHPSPLYEAGGLLVLAVALALRPPRHPGSGQRLARYVAAYSVLRFAVELTRGDAIRGVGPGGVSTSMVLAALALAVVTVVAGRRRAHRA